MYPTAIQSGKLATQKPQGQSHEPFDFSQPVMGGTLAEPKRRPIHTIFEHESTVYPTAIQSGKLATQKPQNAQATADWLR